MPAEGLGQIGGQPLEEQIRTPAEDLDQRSPEVDSLPPSSLRRAREIASVLRRHGLWNLVEAFGLKRHLPFQRSPDPGRADSGDVDPAQFRMALEELGPTFMKLGQVLSTRSDLLPRATSPSLPGCRTRHPRSP
jgi:ubiquinone biosynthesis protein